MVELIGHLFGIIYIYSQFCFAPLVVQKWHASLLKIFLHSSFVVTFEFCSESPCKSYPLCLFYSGLSASLSLCLGSFLRASRFLSCSAYYSLSQTLSFLKLENFMHAYRSCSFLRGLEYIETDLHLSTHLNSVSWSSSAAQTSQQAEQRLRSSSWPALALQPDAHHLWCVTAVDLTALWYVHQIHAC